MSSKPLANLLLAHRAEQPSHYCFAFRPCPRHAINESLDVTGEVLVAILGKAYGNIQPTAFDPAPSFHQSAFTGLDTDVPFDQFGSYGLGPCADVGRIATQARAIDAVLIGLPGFTSHRSFGGVGL